jgi:hypothetical protein
VHRRVRRRDSTHSPGRDAKRRKHEPDRLRAWAVARQQARGHNKAAVALANKLARIAWAMWRSEGIYTATRSALDT